MKIVSLNLIFKDGTHECLNQLAIVSDGLTVLVLSHKPSIHQENRKIRVKVNSISATLSVYSCKIFINKYL